MDGGGHLIWRGDLLLEHLGHLSRLTAWGLVSVAAGLLLFLRDRKSGFGPMTAGWGFVNVLIVAAAVRGEGVGDPEAYRRFLLFNIGLNVLWLGIGFGMFRNRKNAWVSLAGLAMMQQAAVLQGLDLFHYWRITR